MWRPMQIYLYDWWPLLRRSRIFMPSLSPHARGTRPKRQKVSSFPVGYRLRSNTPSALAGCLLRWQGSTNLLSFRLKNPDMIPAQVKPRRISPELLNQNRTLRVGHHRNPRGRCCPFGKKLVALRVNFGDHVRTVLTGMKRRGEQNPREIEGKQALFVVV